MKKLYFIRHGESEANLQKLFAGHWDSPLTDLGRQQAKLAAKKAKGLKIDLIVSSPLSRAKETAEIIAREIVYSEAKILFSDIFMERNYGKLQGMSWETINGLDFETVSGIEPIAHLLERATEAAKFLLNLSEDNILLVSHGTFGRAVRDQILKQTNDVEVPIEQEIPNAQIVRWL